MNVSGGPITLNSTPFSYHVMVLAYNEANREVSVVDRQVLLYRKYSTVQWPWEDLIREATGTNGIRH